MIFPYFPIKPLFTDSFPACHGFPFLENINLLLSMPLGMTKPKFWCLSWTCDRKIDLSESCCWCGVCATRVNRHHHHHQQQQLGWEAGLNWMPLLLSSVAWGEWNRRAAEWSWSRAPREVSTQLRLRGCFARAKRLVFGCISIYHE